MEKDRLMLKEVLLMLKNMETDPKHLKMINSLIDIIDKSKGPLKYRFNPARGDWISIEGYEYRYSHLREVAIE